MGRYGTDQQTMSYRLTLGGAEWRSESVKAFHALPGMVSTPPSRSVVSRTRITPFPEAVSTQDPPLPSE